MARQVTVRDFQKLQAPAAQAVADLLHGSEDSDYPVESDIPCDQCGGVVVLNSAEEDRRLASRVAEGVEIDVLCDACAAQEAPVELKAEDRAEGTNEAIAAFDRGDDEIDEDWEETPTAEEVASFNRIAALVALDVELLATAEMPRSLIVGKIREKAAAAQLDATEDEIQAEAYRIWTSFTENRGGPRVATVDGTTGEVRDWRRPDTTPDRGPDVGTTHHTLTDQNPKDNAFLGVRSDENPEGDSTYPNADSAPSPSGLIPTDAQFSGRLYREAPELANIAERLIGEHGHLAELINCDVRYFWRRKVGAPKGRKPIGATKRTGDLLGHVLGSDFAIWLAADTAREAGFTDRQVEWAVFRQLCRIGADEHGNWISVPPDFEAFAAEIRVYGAPIENLRVARQAFRAGEQMGLFDAADEDDDDSEDVADEVIRQVDEDEDPADPDGPAPDEVDDPLADLPVI